MTTGPLTSAELSDTRRFCGYPVSSALGAQCLGVEGDSATLDVILANLTSDQINTLRTVYLANLYLLESAIPNASSGLNVSQASVFTRNPKELDDRENLFGSWRRKLCFFLGIPAGAGVVPLAPAAFIV